MTFSKLLTPVPLFALAGLLAWAEMNAAAQTLLFDFGGTPTTLGPAPANDPVRSWNNISTTLGQTPNGQLLNLVTTTNAATTIDLTIVSRFNGTNANGATTSTLFPSNATSDSLYGNTASFNGLSNVFPSFKLTDLNPSLLYSFLFYGSRVGAGGDNRETAYTVTGLAASTVSLNASENVNGTVSVLNAAPTAAGEMTISLMHGANNTNANRFSYLNVMQVSVVPEPTAGVLLLGGAISIGLRRWRQRG
jgi:hypothetical protein